MALNWLRTDVTRQRALRDDVTMALVVTPALALVLLFVFDREASSVYAYFGVIIPLTLLGGLGRFAVRRRLEARPTDRPAP